MIVDQASADAEAVTLAEAMALIKEQQEEIETLREDMDDLRDELHEERSKREELESTVEFMSETLWNLDDLVVGPQINPESYLEDNDPVLHQLEGLDGSVESQQSTQSRSAMVKMHRNLADYRDDADMSMKANERRGMFLFRRFIRYLDPDEPGYGVDNSYGKYKMNSDGARKVLDEAHEDTSSNSVKRAMKWVCDLSVPPEVDCNCQKKACQHSMFEFSSDDGYRLSVDEETWENYLESVSAAAGEEVSVTTPDDDGEQPSEGDRQGTRDKLDKITDAADTADGSADTVVSKKSAGVSAGDSHTTR